jgi:hypothetical protein
MRQHTDRGPGPGQLELPFDVLDGDGNVSAFVASSRAAQGLPAHVEDPAVLRAVAAILSGAGTVEPGSGGYGPTDGAARGLDGRRGGRQGPA